MNLMPTGRSTFSPFYDGSAVTLSCPHRSRSMQIIIPRKRVARSLFLTISMSRHGETRLLPRYRGAYITVCRLLRQCLHSQIHPKEEITLLNPRSKQKPFASSFLYTSQSNTWTFPGKDYDEPKLQCHPEVKKRL